MSFEIRYLENKGKCLFATQPILEGSVIFEEDPLVCCQFSWNALCKYRACDHCLRPLETAEENVRRLTGNPSIEIPFPECSDIKTEFITKCSSCGVDYCSDYCRKSALDQYHKILCLQTLERNNIHPLELLEETWKNVHYPPETSSIFLLVRLLARILQASNREAAVQQILNFCHRSSNEDEELTHKFLGEKFADQVHLLRGLVSKALPNQGIEQFLTPEGFQSLIALLGTNGQGVGSSPFSAWRENIKKSNLETQEINQIIDDIYDAMYNHTGDFLNSEGVALYELQSCANHSCDPNAEIAFRHNNFRLSLVALKDISPDTEICISYLDQCNINRSRHSRRKTLQENYLFNCNCAKCLAEIDEPDVTSEESDEDMSEDKDES